MILGTNGAVKRDAQKGTVVGANLHATSRADTPIWSIVGYYAFLFQIGEALSEGDFGTEHFVPAIRTHC